MDELYRIDASSVERSGLASRRTDAAVTRGRAMITASTLAGCAWLETVHPSAEGWTAVTVVSGNSDAGLRCETTVSANDCIPFFREVKSGGATLRGAERIFLRAASIARPRLPCVRSISASLFSTARTLRFADSPP